MKRKNLAFVFTAVFMVSVTATAFAQTTAMVGAPAAMDAPATEGIAVEQMQQQTQMMSGTLTHIDENGSITVKGSAEDDVMIFHLQDSTFRVDAATGGVLNLEENLNKEIKVYYGPAVTLSLPAQATAEAVIGNIVEGNMSANYAVVEDVIAKEGSNDIVITTGAGSTLVTIAADASVEPFKTKNIVTLADIQKGAKVVLWYDVMLLSYPAQAGTDKVVLLQSAEEADSAMAAENEFDYSNMLTHQNDQGKTMVPLREMANKLGYDVQWNGNTEAIMVTKDAQSIMVRVGDMTYGVNKMIVTLDTAPEIVDGVTYVPANFFGEVIVAQS